MRRGVASLAVAVVLVLADSAVAWGQFRAGFLPPSGRGVVRGGGIGVVIPGRRVIISGFVGGFGYRYWGWGGWGSSGWYVGGPCGGILGWGGTPWFGPSRLWAAGWWYPPITTWTPAGWVPGFLPPGWGVGPGWNVGPWGIWPMIWDDPWLGPLVWPLVQAPPDAGLPGTFRAADQIALRPGNPLREGGINPPPVQARDAEAWDGRWLMPPPPEAPREFLVISPQQPGATVASSAQRRVVPVEPTPPATSPKGGVQPFGDYWVISPQRGGVPKAQEPKVAPSVHRSAEPVSTVPEAAVAALPFRVDPFAVPLALKVERPDPDPRKEAQRLVQQGRAAFAAGEYGRAARLFAGAAEKDPDLPFPRYWQAQAEIAAGRYAEAFAALRLGLQRHPQAGAHFDPKEPYGSQPRKYADHLAALRRAVADQPQEPALTYLLAWQLWLAGEKAEARRWWERSQTLGGPADWSALFP
jgi:hypothetical protein